METINETLQEIWYHDGRDLLDELQQDAATAVQVRAFVSRQLDRETVLDRESRKAWLAMSTAQKDTALAGAFPDGVYHRDGVSQSL